MKKIWPIQKINMSNWVLNGAKPQTPNQNENEIWKLKMKSENWKWNLKNENEIWKMKMKSEKWKWNLKNENEIWKLKMKSESKKRKIPELLSIIINYNPIFLP